MMRLNRDKYLLARANACVSIKDLVAAGIPRDTLYRAEKKKMRLNECRRNTREEKMQ